MGNLYDDQFFDWVDRTAQRSAVRMIPLVQRMVDANSVVDVGCGRGTWLAQWKAFGVDEIKGLDGGYIDRARLAIDASAFTAVNLAEPASVEVPCRFDLAQSLEVAEHLPAASAADFVALLCALSDVVLFSAAQPGQGGEDHINEQAPSFWAGLFKQRGFAAFDCLRPIAMQDDRIARWYRFNIFIFANSTGAGRLSQPARSARVDDLTTLDGGGDLGWRLRRAVLRPLPVPAVTWLSRRHYSLACTMARLKQGMRS